MQIYGHRGFSTLIYMMITMITMRSIGPSYKGRSAFFVALVQNGHCGSSMSILYNITITMMVVITALVTSLVIVIFSALIIENHLIRKLEVVNHIVKITKLCQKEF